MSPTSSRPPAADACPSHYRIPDADCKRCGHPIQPVDLLQSLDGLTFNICKYALRAGNKAGEPTLKDLHKCMDYVNLAIERELRRRGGFGGASGSGDEPQT